MQGPLHGGSLYRGNLNAAVNIDKGRNHRYGQKGSECRLIRELSHYLMQKFLLSEF